MLVSIRVFVDVRQGACPAVIRRAIRRQISTSSSRQAATHSLTHSHTFDRDTRHDKATPTHTPKSLSHALPLSPIESSRESAVLSVPVINHPDHCQRPRITHSAQTAWPSANPHLL